MRKKNFAQKTLILLVLFALVFGSVFTEQVKAEPLDANEAENSEAAITEPDLSAEAEPGNIEPDNVEPELETPATIASDSDQESNDESNEGSNQEANDAVLTESESESEVVAAESETGDNELLPEPGIEETIESTDGATEPTEKAPELTEEAIEPTEETIEPEDEVAESAEVAAESTGETESTKQTSDNTEELPMLNSERQIAVRAATLNMTQVKNWLDNEINIKQKRGSGECVSFCNYYLTNCWGNSAIRGNANDWKNRCPEGWTVINLNGSFDNCRMGDLLVEEYYPYGHVSVYYGKEGGKHYVVDQNNAGRRYTDKGRLWANFSNPMTCFRPPIGSTTTHPSVSFTPWENPKYTYIHETDAAIGQDVVVSNGNCTETGMYLYSNDGKHLATGKNMSHSITKIFFRINAECGYILTPGTTYKYKFYAIVNGETFWGNEGSFKTLSIAPTEATLNISSTSIIEGQELTFTASGNNNPTKYEIGIDKDSERVLTQDMAEGVLSINTLAAGEYSAYVHAANAAGGINSARIDFTVRARQTAPTSATLTVSSNSVTEGETLTFTASGDNNPAKYTIGIDKDSERVLTQDMAEGVLSINTLAAGEYTAYVTAANSAGSTDSARITFTVVEAKPVIVRGYIYANSIIRSAPNGNIITKLWRPILITGTIEGAWLKFSYNGRTAYVAAKLVTNRNPAMTGYAKQKLYVRNTPNGAVTDTILRGTQVKGVLVGNMVRFTHKGKTAYVYAVLLQKNPVRATTYILANSVIRSAPNGSIVSRPWRPFLVTGIIEGAWFKFTYNGSTAYVALRSTTTRNPVISGYAKQKLYVRNTPNGSVTDTILRGTQVKGVLVGNMVRFTHKGKTAYVYAVLLQKNPVPAKTTRYIYANSIIRSSPNGSIVTRPWRPLRVSGTIQGAWFKFTYNGKPAYVAIRSTTTRNPVMTGYAKQTLYVRYTPNGNVVATLPAGYRVSGVLVGNMVKFTYNNRTAYVYATLLRK